jgi:hypothetical protein
MVDGFQGGLLSAPQGTRKGPAVRKRWGPYFAFIRSVHLENRGEIWDNSNDKNLRKIENFRNDNNNFRLGGI